MSIEENPCFSASLTGIQGNSKSFKFGVGESITKVEGHVYTNVTETKVWSFEDINAAFDKLADKIWLHMTPMGIQILAGEN